MFLQGWFTPLAVWGICLLVLHVVLVLVPALGSTCGYVRGNRPDACAAQVHAWNARK